MGRKILPLSGMALQAVIQRVAGVRVTGSPDRGAVLAKVQELVTLAARHGYRRAEVVAMIEGIASPDHGLHDRP